MTRKALITGITGQDGDGWEVQTALQSGPSPNGPCVGTKPVALLLSIWAATQTSIDQWSMLGAFAIAGTILYFIARRKPTGDPPG